MALFGNGLLNGQQQQPMPQMPRVPWSQNPLVTSIGLGLLGGRNINEGFANAAAAAPAGMVAKTTLQAAMQKRQDDEAAKAAQRAAWNAGMRWKSGGMDWNALSPEDQAALSAAPEIAAKFMPKETELPNSVQEYQYGLGDPAYNDWRVNLSQASAPKTIGTPPPGYRVKYDNAGNPVMMEPVPGSPAAAEADAATRANQSKVEQKGQKAVTMLDATTSIKDEIKNASTPVTGTLSRPFAMYSGSSAGRVRAYVGALKSGVGLQALSALKELSATGASGFGALNQAELQLLLDQVGALDPDNTEPDIFLKTIDRIEQQWQQVLNDVERTVPPERLAELGININDLRGGAPGGGQNSGPSGAADPLGIR